ncbi:LAMI_0H13586g1_1 [Lachancea mirantina]|uniref:LAMI_0H13586g1_1 n=1 Tax=Lachancea mirantina TaxID=1230905 RepID=A0A1G4KI15_9SACH|nr:LAMI_0H13586g1_1 [Lachancea mirantina]
MSTDPVPMEVSLTVGKLDASLALLTTKDHHVIEFPTMLLPDNVKAGSIVKIQVSEDAEKELQEFQEFQNLQSEIMEKYGTHTPSKPEVEVINVTQTSCVLGWKELDLGSAHLKSLILYKDGARSLLIPNPLKTTSTKISGLSVDSKYTFQLKLCTTSGNYLSEEITVQTHKMTDLSGITPCLGTLESMRGVTVNGIETSLAKIGAKPLQTKVSIDTTHFITNDPDSEDAEFKKAQQSNIPIVVPEWIRACELEGRIVGVRGFYLDADKSNLESYRFPKANDSFNDKAPVAANNAVESASESVTHASHASQQTIAHFDQSSNNDSKQDGEQSGFDAVPTNDDDSDLPDANASDDQPLNEPSVIANGKSVNGGELQNSEEIPDTDSAEVGIAHKRDHEPAQGAEAGREVDNAAAEPAIVDDKESTHQGDTIPNNLPSADVSVSEPTDLLKEAGSTHNSDDAIVSIKKSTQDAIENPSNDLKDDESDAGQTEEGHGELEGKMETSPKAEDINAPEPVADIKVEDLKDDEGVTETRKEETNPVGYPVQETIVDVSTDAAATESDEKEQVLENSDAKSTKDSQNIEDSVSSDPVKEGSEAPVTSVSPELQSTVPEAADAVPTEPQPAVTTSNPGSSKNKKKNKKKKNKK